MRRRLAVRDHQDLAGAVLVGREELARHREGVLHVGAGDPHVPRERRQVVRLDGHGVVGEADHPEAVAGELAADQRFQGERDALGRAPRAEHAPSTCSGR